MSDRLPRPKDVLKQYLRERGASHEALTHMLFDFVYWMEGQDRQDMKCRYHIAPALESECPFDVTDRGPDE